MNVNEKSRFNITLNLHRTRAESSVTGKKEPRLQIKVKYKGTEIYDLTMSPQEVVDKIKGSPIAKLVFKVKKEAHQLFKKAQPYGIAAINEIKNTGSEVFLKAHNNIHLYNVENELNYIFRDVFNKSDKLAAKFVNLAGKAAVELGVKPFDPDLYRTENDIYRTPLEKEEQIFRHATADLKHPLSEFYSAEVVFLKTLNRIKTDPELLEENSSLTKIDREKLNELIVNTKRILEALPTFKQLGVAEAAQIRTLNQDLQTQISYAARLEIPEAAVFQEILELQSRSGEMKARASFDKNPESKQNYLNQSASHQAKIDALMKSMAGSKTKEVQKILSLHKQVEGLKNKLNNLPEIPKGVLDNLSNLLATNLLREQYALLKHFKLKLDVMAQEGNPHYSKYQEIGSKITRYSLPIEAILKAIPDNMQHKGLKDLQEFLAQEAKKINKEPEE